MSIVLKLDVTGQPRGWLSINEAVLAYARSGVLYGIGDPLPPIFGGIQRSSGIRSRINLQPIIALEGACLGNSFLDYAIEPYFEGMIIAVFTAAKNLQNRILLVIMFDQFRGGVRIVGKML